MIYPEWTESVRQMFVSDESNMFVVHGNIHDDVWDGEKLVSMEQFLTEWAKASNKNFIKWLPYKDGVNWCALGEDVQKAFSHSVNKDGNFIWVSHAGSLFPNGDTQYRSSDERAVISLIQDKALNSSSRNMNSIVLFFVESLNGIANEFLNNPRISTINIPFPDIDVRTKLIQSLGHDSNATLYAQHTAGLKLIQIETIFNLNKGLSEKKREQLIRNMLVEKKESLDIPLDEKVKALVSVTGGMSANEISKIVGYSLFSTPDSYLSVLDKRKKSIIEKECSGLIEFIETKYGFEAVGGQDRLKAELSKIANLFKSGNKKLSPMGILAVGPMGAGKTFLIKAFLKEAGLTGVVLKNFRSKWVGSTESNLDKVLSTVKAMGPVAVIIDESDRSFGGGGGDNDGGTSSRVIAKLKEFMSDTDNRGQVLFIMLTNRPDKLDADIKRPGRLDYKIPFFYAENSDEIKHILIACANKYKIDLPNLIEDDLINFIGYSNADLEALVGLYANILNSGADKLNAFKEASNDFIPPQEPDMIKYMELLAVQEASRKSLVPEKFHGYYIDNKLFDELTKLKNKVNYGV